MLIGETEAISGLNSNQVLEARRVHGSNIISVKKQNRLWLAVISLIREPMVLLLLITSLIYFLTGNYNDGFFLGVSVLLVSAISLLQDARSRDALEKLKQYTKPRCKVIRNGKTQWIDAMDLVVGDCLIIEEGSSVAADGIIINANDFSVNEAILTGESFPVTKHAGGNDEVYQGTLAVSGMAVISVTAIGDRTKLADIGKIVEDITAETTPLELQINAFVKKMVYAGATMFLIVWLLNYQRSHNFPDSLVKALALAMSILPEEIPVAVTTFMALGAWRLMKAGIVVKQMKTVETLGSATVICLDKTGTITENRMVIAELYTPHSGSQVYTDSFSASEVSLLTAAMWASEQAPFDPMEKAIHQAYSKLTPPDERTGSRMIHEYPLSGIPPMMTHIFLKANGEQVVAAKGAPEALFACSVLTADERRLADNAMHEMAAKGYRVLGVGIAEYDDTDFPSAQQDFHFTFKGLIAFYDPPKANIGKVLERFYKAGIRVKLITGDNTATTIEIARQVGFRGYADHITGEELMQLTAGQLSAVVQNVNVFTRMFPDAKLKVINALKSRGNVVAMTGDGVNDAPALKAAHIGIAMGKKGTEVAREAAALILLEDDLSSMANAVAMGRKIYTNLKKAIGYILSIHIPIILTVFFPLVLGWKYPNIFTPVHIVFLELIMGPTCSVVYENEPMEPNMLEQVPRGFSDTFFNWPELTRSIIQGLAITAGTLMVYHYAQNIYSLQVTRTIVFITIVSANIFLTLVNRSFYYSLLNTIQYPNRLVWYIVVVTIILCVLLIRVQLLAGLFGFASPGLASILGAIAAGMISVAWFEVWKWQIRKVKSVPNQ
ncbi:haloacid dehalogenase [Mucilaginibacter sp. PPCGB 2223]|uniref:cation-translocating P-type ATPase n=1 Tax=Mucilaginibacter sp. PPCGB 2223 TaxID=1886027 RepID=UPI0008269C89|nr:cation-translocating P-type ATPase [Mucilaginibacter sp. PPCGB 2223]OCX54829.1 haloacid dehalogenase [Mucilaginibacter sp. PPCGB 2223]